MPMRATSSWVVLTAATMMLAAPGASGVFQREPKGPTFDDYEILLQKVLPRALGGAVYGFAIRVIPSFAPEWQLVVKELPGRTVRAEITSVVGPSASDVLFSGPGSAGVTLTLLADRIRVEKQPLDVPIGVAHRWRNGLFDAMRASADNMNQRALKYERTGREELTVLNDGTIYDLWYLQRGSLAEIHWSVTDVPKGAPNAPLVEYGFTVTGTLASYHVGAITRGTSRSVTLRFVETPLAAFHTHPTNDPIPSTPDMTLANLHHIPIFMITARGLGIYDGTTGEGQRERRVIKGREGIKWSRPEGCQ